MTISDPAKRANETLAWFFTDPTSRYELAEVIRLTGCSRDDIQNWVKREMIEPDDTTPGRRIYLPATVATLKIAAVQRSQGVAANDALMQARVITDVTLRWLAVGKRNQFTKDFRQHYAAFHRQEAGGVLYVHILPRGKLNDLLDLPHVGILRIQWLWQNLADAAKHLKDRPSRRLKPEASE